MVARPGRRVARSRNLRCLLNIADVRSAQGWGKQNPLRRPDIAAGPLRPFGASVSDRRVRRSRVESALENFVRRRHFVRRPHSERLISHVDGSARLARLTSREGVCYVAPTLRGFRDLISRPQSIADARTSAVARRLAARIAARIAARRAGRREGRSARRGLAWLLVGALVGAGAGCGPVGYLQQVQGRARQAVAEAQQAGADRAAPYEYTAAVEYLKKAEEEGAHAEYRVAIELGRRSEDFAKRASALARRPGPPAAGGEERGRDREPDGPEARRGKP